MKINSIHFVGIKGVGMTPLAVIAKEAGMEVTGSDLGDVYITDTVLKKVGIHPLVGFSKEHINKPDLVITTGAHGGFDNIEVKKAKKMSIPVMTQGEAVGYFMSGELFGREDSQGISVAGCHGKTTTTAMIATILKLAGKDPSFIIGTGNIPSLGSSGHYGKGSWFVAESDEYATEPKHDKTPKFLWQHPEIAVITNIEYDHPDLYPTFESLVAAYKQFMLQVLENDGTLVVCGDDPEIQKITENKKGKIITYGFNSSNTFVLSNLENVVGGTSFNVSCDGKDLGEVMIPVLGAHNALNAVATIAVGLSASLSFEEIKKSLSKFKGTKRRLEFIGQTESGAYVYDDYAHHPTEINKTLTALRERYKDMNIICVFQPHTFSRTKLLFGEFKDSFSQINAVFLTDIYASQRELFDSSISSNQLSEAISQKQRSIYLPKLEDVIEYIKKKQFGSDTIIVTMGAGDVYKIAYEITKK